ncbi:unnamed protein product [Ambrosiozyma monospora]|uniref:Unnamed protein product n=1 Tax=Ambrosiozyma monospora TaxID=43982 RepID=A0ACB5SY28_AMBMO|nr:unnamed protein product [Ambrosiozyma monospora]
MDQKSLKQFDNSSIGAHLYSFCIPNTKIESWFIFLKSDELLTRAFYLLLQRVNARFDDDHITLESCVMTNFMKFNEISKGMIDPFVDFLLECLENDSRRIVSMNVTGSDEKDNADIVDLHGFDIDTISVACRANQFFIDEGTGILEEICDTFHNDHNFSLRIEDLNISYPNCPSAKVAEILIETKKKYPLLNIKTKCSEYYSWDYHAEIFRAHKKSYISPSFDSEKLGASYGRSFYKY